MKTFHFVLYCLCSTLAIGAGVKISDLQLSTSPSTNTYLEIADLNASGTNKSAKILYTNLATKASLTTAGIWTNAASRVRLGTTNDNSILQLSADDGLGQGSIELWTAASKRLTLGASSITPSASTFDLGSSSAPFQSAYIAGLTGLSLSRVTVTAGNDSPEGVRIADVSSLYLQTNGVSGTTLWTKVTGVGNTGWSTVAVGSGAPVGTVVNTVSPSAAGVPLVFRGTDTTNAVPGYGGEPVVTKSANYTVLYTDNSTFFVWNSATNCTVTFNDGATNGFNVTFKNLGAGSLILTNASGKTFDSATSVTLPISTITHWIGDGTNYRGGRGSPKNLNGPNVVYASPSDGSTGIMVPRALVAADLPSGTTPTAANPTASIGLTANNGSATTFMRSDASPALGSVGTAGTYRSVTTDAAGRVTAGTAPTTFSGYAISDTSANLAAALTDETGTGVAVFGTAPVFTTSIELRNGANAQTALINGTYTDSTNYRRGKITDSTAGVFDIGSEGLGTGATGNTLRFLTDGTARWMVNSSGHFLAVLDNTYDIGASGATRPKNIYAAGTLTVAGAISSGSISTTSDIQIPLASVFFWSGRSQIASPANGVIKLQDSTTADFSRLQLGGTTASFPSIKRSTTNLVARLADDSADTGVEAIGVGTIGGATITTSATGATNTLSVNVLLYVTAATGASLTDNAGTTEYSGVTIANFTPVRLQPGGKFTGTSVTYATGTASHTW